MKNKEIKLIKNNPKKAIITLMIPIIMSSLFESLNSVIDSIWVSGLGVKALTATGFVSPIFLGLVGIGIGLGIGTNSVISRLLGGKKLKEANNAAIHSIILSIIISIILTLILTIFLKDILLLLGAETVLKEATDYGFYLFIGSSILILPEILGGIFLAEGQSKRATYPLILIAISNIILNPIFIYILNLGIKGAAIATILANIIGLIIILYWLFINNKSSFEYKKENYKRNLKIYKEILEIGIPAGLEEDVLAILCIILNILILQVAGADSVGAFSIAWRVMSIGIVPCIGVGSAAVTVAGMAYGAKNYKNLKTTIRYSTKVGFLISAAIFIILNIFASQIATIFTYSENSASLTPMITYMIRMISFIILAEPFGDVSTYVLQGMGKGITSFILILQREIFWIILCVYLIGIVLNLKLEGILIGIDIGMIIGSAIAYICAELYIKKTKLENS